MELQIIEPKNDIFSNEIKFNDEQIKAEVSEALKKYEGLVYSEDQIRNAKSDMAGLRKFKEAIENKRKEIKKKCMEPYERFEAKIKEILKLVDKPILMINGQVENFEQKSFAEKKKSIEAIYEQHIGELKGVLPLGRMWSDKWANVTVTLKQIEAQIDDLVEQVSKDLNVIETLKSEFELQIKDHYLRTFDLSGALAEKSRLESQKIKIEELKNKVPTAPVQMEIKVPEQPQVEDLFEVGFLVTATKRQLDDLKKFLEFNKIKYRRA
ncbi:DUF1351 domain-containing protein [Polynucleobacter sp.]|uniref:DUF1351 domain-containing protein n=1 Tax=Polynucleobacter sp. TaxID=2029855 RepID=UPI003F694FD4